MGKEELIEIFKDTMNQCETEISLVLEAKKSVENQALYYDEDDVFVPFTAPRQFSEEALVVVSKKRSFEAASFYKKGRVNMAVLNFASSTNPGGGVINGSSAQEECLCRTSTLYKSLSSKEAVGLFYEPHRAELDGFYNDDIIYTPQVAVFKTDEELPKNLPLKDRFFVNVITCAAPNLSRIKEAGLPCSEERLREVFMKRMKRIVEVALANANDTLILGAFGCGAFGNDARLVAECWKEVLKDYLHAFKIIEFAVFCKGDDKNYMDFRKVFG